MIWLIGVPVVVLIMYFCFPMIFCFLTNLWRIPYYAIRDIYKYIRHKKWQEFRHFGIDVYIGYFGMGKTLSTVVAVYRIYKFHMKYKKKIKILSNIHLVGIPYDPLFSFQQIVDLEEENDPEVGYVVLLDEVSTLLSHRNYASFPLELLASLTQPRKIGKGLYIIATTQRWFMVDKIFRSLVRNCIDCTKHWRFVHNNFYDAWDYETAVNIRMISRIRNVWRFIPNKYFALYDTKEHITRYAQEDFISNEQAMIRKGLDGSASGNEMMVKNQTRKLKKIIKKG